MIVFNTLNSSSKAVFLISMLTEVFMDEEVKF